jgi:hypothetical protein
VTTCPACSRENPDDAGRQAEPTVVQALAFYRSAGATRYIRRGEALAASA